MDPEEHATFSVTGFEVNIIPGTEYAFVRVCFVEKPLQTAHSVRRYVFSYGQLAELRDVIDRALLAFKNALKRDPPAPSVH